MIVAAEVVVSQGWALAQAAQGDHDNSSLTAGAVSPGGPAVQPVSLEGPTSAGGTPSDGGGSSGGGSSGPSPYTYHRDYIEDSRASSGVGFLCQPIPDAPPGR